MGWIALLFMIVYTLEQHRKSDREEMERREKRPWDY